MIYKVLVSVGPHDRIKTILVEEESFDADGGDSSIYFTSDFRMNIKDYGTVEIEGPAEHMVPDTLEGT